MADRFSNKQPFLKRMLHLILPTIFIWILIFEWIAQAHPGIQIVTRITFIVFGSVWFFRRLRYKEPLRISTLGVLLFGYYLYSAFLVPSAPLPFHSLEIELSYIFYFLIFLFYINDVTTQNARNAWHFAFLQAAIFFSLSNLFLAGQWWQGWFQISGPGFELPPFGYRLPGLFLQHPNVEAAYLNLILPFVFVDLFRNSGWRKSIGVICLLFLFLTTSFFASSRGAWLATGSSLGITVVLLYWEQIVTAFNHFVDRRRLHLSFKTLAIIALGIAAISAIGYISFLQARFGGHGGRWGIWSTAWDIFKSAPLLGHGPGSFHVLAAVEAGIPPGFYLVHAHNIFLQIMGEAGLVGLTIICSIIYVSIRLIIIAWQQKGTLPTELIPYVAVLVGMVTHQLVDFAFESPLYTVGILFTLATISRLEQPAAFMLQRRLSRSGFILVLLLFYGSGSLITLIGTPKGYDGVLAALDGDWGEAQARLCQARDINSSNSLFYYQCGFSSAVASAFNLERDILDEAIKAYDDGLSRDPYWPYHEASRASLLWEKGEQTQALQALLKAQELAPRSSIIALNLAYYFTELEEPTLAQNQIDLAFVLNPWYWISAEDPWKPSTDAFDQIILQDLESRLNPSTYQAWKGWMNITRGNFEIAENAFKTSIQFNPARTEALAGLAYLARERGDLDDASRYLGIADLTGSNSWILEDVRGRISASAGEQDKAYTHWLAAARMWLWASSSGPYYESVYRRAYIPIDFPPQFLQPSLPSTISDAYDQMIEHGSLSIRTDAMKILPWVESQIHLAGTSQIR